MTLATTTDRAESTGDGVSTVIPFPYYFLNDSDLVYVQRAADGTETTKLLGSDYTVTGAGLSSGGSVIAAVAPAAGVKNIIYRDPPQTQDVDYIEGDKFPADTHERALDKLTMLVQRLAAKVARSMQLRVSDATTGGSYDAGNNYIINVKDPVNNQDAVTINYLKTYLAAVITSAISIVVTTDYGTLASGTQVKYRRGTNAQTLLFTGAAGEVTIDTSFNRIVVHDGATVGGFAMLPIKGGSGSSMLGRFGLASGAPVASASIPSLGTDGNIWHITGGTAITGFGTPTGCGPFFLIFDAALTLTHNATSFILPGGANIVTAAGDIAEFVQDGNQSGNWRCVMYTRAAGGAAGATIPTGTRMLFNQTAAPVGWTKETSINDNAAFRFTTGTASNNNGTSVFTSVFGASKVTGNHVLTISEIPAHTHDITIASSGAGSNPSTSGTAGGHFASGSAGGGSGHTHTLSLDIRYHDIIIAQAP